MSAVFEVVENFTDMCAFRFVGHMTGSIGSGNFNI